MEIKGLRKIEPYVAGSQPAEKNIIKLNTNENAYGPSPAVHQALASFMSISYASIRLWIERFINTCWRIRIGNNNPTIFNQIILSINVK